MISCLFCNGLHETITCSVYPTISCRMELLNSKKGCYRCLMTGHIPPQCRHVVPCSVCDKKSHHTALCWRIDSIRDVKRVETVVNEVCGFCQKHLRSDHCRRYNTHVSRREAIRAANRCVLCLMRHPGFTCTVPPVKCGYCRKADHHKALCTKSYRLEECKDIDPAFVNCLFCNGHRDSTCCTTVTTKSQRAAILTRQGRCFKCLRVHETENCYNRYRCRLCRSSDHHQVLCHNDPNIVIDETTETASIASDSSSQTSSSSPQHCEPERNQEARQTFFDFITRSSCHYSDDSQKQQCVDMCHDPMATKGIVIVSNRSDGSFINFCFRRQVRFSSFKVPRAMEGMQFAGLYS